MEQALKARREVDGPEKARFWIKRRAERLQSRLPVEKTPSNNSEVKQKICTMKMALPMGILLCLVIASMGLTVFAIADNTPIENESNDMESTIKSRNDYDPNYDDLSSFFDFEIGPPSITYKESADTNAPTSLHARPNTDKNYYFYHSEHPKHKNHISISPKKQVVTPGTHYKPSTEKTFVEEEEKPNESKPILNQKIGAYQVSIVDADSPLFSRLGITQEELAKITGYKKIMTNASMLTSDSTQTATYAEQPRPNYPNSGYPPPNSPSYQTSYDSSKYPPPGSSYGERQHQPNERYAPSENPNPPGDYNHAASSHHPPPQGSYDAKSYKSLQNGGYSQDSSGHNYPHPPHNYHATSPNAHSNHPPPPTSYSNPPPPPAPYNPHPPPYSQPPPHSASHNPSSSYNPQRSSGEPWRPHTQAHTDWDDKHSKKESWQSGSYPPHPPPPPYSSTSSGSGTYYQPKPYYGTSSEKTGHRYASSYKPESSSKPAYSSSSAASSSSAEYNSHKPYYSSSTYSSSSKVPARAGSVTVAASSHHHHAPAKPGITISFKAKAPSHGHGHGGVNIPLSFSPLEVVKKLLPLSALNPLNNKKVTIGITIENKKDHHPEYHAY